MNVVSGNGKVSTTYVRKILNDNWKDRPCITKEILAVPGVMEVCEYNGTYTITIESSHDGSMTRDKIFDLLYEEFK